MAAVTIPVYEDMWGVTITLTYDDVTLDVSSITGTNTGTNTVTAIATDTGTGRSWTVTMGPGFNQTVNVPGGRKFALVADPTTGALSWSGWTLAVQ